MTIIIATAEGLYADSRAIHLVGSTFIPTEANKIHIAPAGTCAIAFAGVLVEKKLMTKNLLTDLLTTYSFMKYFCDIVKKVKNNDAFFDIWADYDTVMRSLIDDISNTIGSSYIAVTKDYNFTFNKGEEIQVFEADVFRSMGSGEVPAAMLHLAGYLPLEIIKKIAIFDTMVYDGPINAAIRKYFRRIPWLSKTRGIITIKEQYEKLTVQQARALMTAEYVVLQWQQRVLQIMKVKDRLLPLPNAASYRVYARKALVVYEKAQALNKEQITEKLHELYDQY